MKRILGLLAFTVVFGSFQNCSPGMQSSSADQSSTAVESAMVDQVPEDQAQQELQFAAESLANGTGERNYRMALYDNDSATYGDLTMFGEGGKQPAGDSIMLLNSADLGDITKHGSGDVKSYEKTLNDSIKKNGYDINRIKIVQLIAPFSAYIKSKDSKGCPSDSNEINKAKAAAQDMASAVKTSLSKSKIWLNFNKTEVGWMMSKCKQGSNTINIVVNSIDLLSVTGFFTDFDTDMKPYNDYLMGKLAKTGLDNSSKSRYVQQLVLVPGVIFVFGSRQQSAIATDLTKYIGYADEANAHCTQMEQSHQNSGGIEGCPIHSIVGYSAYPILTYSGDPNVYVGLSHKLSSTIRTTWFNNLARPRKATQ